MTARAEAPRPHTADPSDVILPPGAVWFGQAPARVRTLLGSCVALTVWHPRQRVGGMCHFLLPRREAPAAVLDGRFGDEAFALLLREMRRHGTPAAQYEAKLFGGGRMFAMAAGDSAPSMDVQRRNVAQARALVADHGLALHAEHLGGAGHRQIVLELDTGGVWVRHTPLAPPHGDVRPHGVSPPAGHTGGIAPVVPIGTWALRQASTQERR